MHSDDPSMTRTDWSMIQKAIGGEEAGAAAGSAMEQLARRYWPAVYAFIRSTGRDVHESADLTQGFVCDVVIGRGLLATADQQRGRFRNLLLEALRNYLHERHRNEHAACRSPVGNASGSVALDPQELSDLDVGVDQPPDEAFDMQWGATLIRRVLEQVQRSCVSDGMEPHWSVFEFRVARPMLLGESPTSYDVLVRRLELNDASQAANMMVTVKRRFARTLFVEAARTVGDPEEAEAELNELMSKLGSIVLPGGSHVIGIPRERGPSS